MANQPIPLNIQLANVLVIEPAKPVQISSWYLVDKLDRQGPVSGMIEVEQHDARPVLASVAHLSLSIHLQPDWRLVLVMHAEQSFVRVQLDSSEKLPERVTHHHVAIHEQGPAKITIVQPLLNVISASYLHSQKSAD